MGLWKDDYTVKVRYVETNLQHSRSHKYRSLTLVSYFIQNPQPSLLQSGLQLSAFDGWRLQVY